MKFNNLFVRLGRPLSQLLTPIYNRMPAKFRKNETATSATTGVIAFIALAILAMLIGAKFYPWIMGHASALISSDARAEGQPQKHITIVPDGWFIDASASLYLEKQIDQWSNFCKSGNNNDLTSYISLDTTIYKRQWFEAHTGFDHHSCAFGLDNRQYDSWKIIGIVVRWTR